jgi:protein-disulfide isomerase
MQMTARTAALVAGALLVGFGAGAVAFLPNGAPTDGPAVEKVVHAYLLKNPQLLIEMQTALQEKQEAEETEARNTALGKLGREALTNPKIAYATGPADAKVTIVEFFDYKCGYCKASLAAMKKALGTHKDVRFAFVEYPILSPESLVAARAAVASRRQGDKYVPFHLALMEATGALPEERILELAKSVGLDVAQLKTDMDDKAVMDSLQASRELADKLRINGTPTFIINDKFHVGQVTETGESSLASLIKAAQG